ncbi:hypothetical protein [Tessaracoccus oleiagri]|uniref:Uncharacterized protein n=1 Tax=Tessaracoccus oleiagri TaxID=686624 RepID=A0A1G9MF14_9ACTN|nr:hypothetical protein [Tessaracoccus oleiagri]SDL72789.1 hypothetical protein SAMN04488242_2591 [Tessaracoccus oleiagri]
MSEKSEVQNLDDPGAMNEPPLDVTPDAQDTGHVIHGGPRNYGEEGSGSVDELRDTDIHDEDAPER